MIPELWDLLGGSALIALGGEKTIGMGTKPDGSVHEPLRCELSPLARSIDEL
jgi:hypothetical protein